MATMQQISELREKTGVGVLQCKEALLACNDNIEKAIDYLREKGLASAAKPEGRIAAEGVRDTYFHGLGKKA